MNQTSFSKINTYSLLFAFIVISFLALVRLATLLIFGDSSDIQNNLSVLDNLFFVGLKFDLRVVGTVLLLLVYLPFLLIFWKQQLPLFLVWVKWALCIALIGLVLLAFLDIGYVVFFGTTIDILIFGFLEDDTQAVIESGLGDPRFMLISTITVVATSIITLLYLKLSITFTLKKTLRFIPKKVWSLLLIVPLLLIMARGSIDTFPLSERQSSISNNGFINSLTQNAVFHLNYAYNNRKENDFNQSATIILAVAGVSNEATLITKAGFTQQHPLQAISSKKSFNSTKAPHIIFVLMEGWSSHIALNDSANNPVLGRFKRHAADDYFLPRFFSNQYGTNPTIENTLLNTPITPLSQSSAYKTTFSLSNILPFQRHGYTTSFISGGYSSWRNHDIFWPKQGFDKYIDRSIIEKKYQVIADNPWGVYDEYLFRYLEDSLTNKSANKPSFSFVMTTNNHPPVRLPNDYNAPDFDVRALGINDNIAHKNTMLAGYHYQTDALGGFLDWLKQSPFKEEVIVVATGDHILKGFDDYNSVEKQFLRYAVPAYFYIPKQYDQLAKRPKALVNSLVGSHVDLFPTLYELTLSNASYYAFGTPIMQKSLDSAYGWNDRKALITQQGIINLETNKRYMWNKQHQTLLEATEHTPSAQQLTLIKQEKYRRWLKAFLLYKDKEALEQQE